MAKYQDNSGYEKRDVNVVKVVLWGMAGLFVIVISLIILNEYFLSVKEDYYYEMVRKPKSKDLAELRQRETEELTSYKLLDKENGVYRIPIKKAMELIVEEYQDGARKK